jgi:purine-cytosine permease-like protein
MLAPAHGFGKFLTVLISLGLVGNVAATFYSVSLNFQMLMPVLVVVPRYIFSIIATAMYVVAVSFLLS